MKYTIEETIQKLKKEVEAAKQAKYTGKTDPDLVVIVLKQLGEDIETLINAYEKLDAEVERLTLDLNSELGIE